MMGPTHALSGVAAFLAAAPFVERYLTPMGPFELVVGTALAAGAALVPDLDHADATIANTYGPLTGALAWFVSLISGGHRNGTHSLLGIAVFTGLAYAATWSDIAAGIVCWVLLGVAVRGFGATGDGALAVIANAVLAGAAAAALVVFVPGVLWMLPVAMGIGAAAHVVGDCLTDMGCPLAWPLSQTMMGLPLVDTDGLREKYIVVPGLTVGAAVLSLVATGVWSPLVRYVTAAI